MEYDFCGFSLKDDTLDIWQVIKTMVSRLERISLVVKGDMMVVTGLSRLRNVLVVTWECKIPLVIWEWLLRWIRCRCWNSMAL